jgi:membrane protein DedA with SNARE-associated domain
MEKLDTLLLQAAGDPWLQSLLLFAGAFVLEEAAVAAGAMLTAEGELWWGQALGALLLGITVSDWALYGLGWAATRFAWVRARVEGPAMSRGRLLLNRNLPLALLSARIVPWLLFPVFVGCGLLRISFATFVTVNLAIVVVYASALFAGLTLMNAWLLDFMGRWAWLVVAALLAGCLAWRRRAARHGAP